MKLQAYRPSHQSFDIASPIDRSWDDAADLIVHAAAYTNVEGAETDKEECFKTNVYGTFNLLNTFSDLPVVYISTEYAHNPINFYSMTKMLGEQLVMSHTAPYLIIRTLFKPRPWPYDKAFRDKWTMGDYVDVIAEKIDKEIEQWDRKSSKLIYVGTGRKTYYELAQETKPDVIPNSIKDIKGVKIPSDYK